MNRITWLAWVGLTCLMAAGCHKSNEATAPASSSPASAATARPAASANDTVWGNYLAAQGKIHGKDIAMHPYIYVIPAGDSPGATTRRQEELDSISSAVGPILIPGSLLILGGPDSSQTAAFTVELSKRLKADALKGMVVLVIGEPAQATAVANTLKPTGATVRFATM